MWTLLVQRHADLWRAGAYLFGRNEADAKVPGLASRDVAAKRVDATAAK